MSKHLVGIIHDRADVSPLVRLVPRVCGEKPDGTVTETSSSNTMSVRFYSDASYVDRGFKAEFEAIDVKNRKRLSSSQMFIIS